jgi:hypothetical protein
LRILYLLPVLRHVRINVLLELLVRKLAIIGLITALPSLRRTLCLRRGIVRLIQTARDCIADSLTGLLV